VSGTKGKTPLDDKLTAQIAEAPPSWRHMLDALGERHA
jgi:hypothetical protein